MGNEQKTKFDAENFVEFLLNEGAEVFCDNNVQVNETALPQFYDEKLFKRGQLFYQKHRFALDFGMLLGLIAGLAIPFFRNVLSLTKKSSTPPAAGKRYMNTITHLNTWYQSDCSPNSELWKSIISVRNLHISASTQLRKAGNPKISQGEMAITLSGFIGVALIKREKVGLYNVPEEDWKALIHVWRVIAHLLGVEDKFNICRESVEETTDICKVIKDKIVTPFANEASENYIFMVKNLVDGFVKPFAPFLNTNILLALVCRLSENNDNKELINIPVALTIWEKIMLLLMTLGFASMRFTFFRLFHNYLSSLMMLLFT